MRLGFKLIAEAFSPTEIVDQAVRAEAAGFDFVEVSDHFQTWVSEHEHSGFDFSMLTAIAVRTSRIELATGVTCPFIRFGEARRC
ncbi:LLM class flavin-dependent oxidoreductase [Kribbella sp. VKM Ac-2568]|uniref:LLM class flavin-dependent oxidoreductase n=1 Tax=Kribbella sp. VKM Ac-2568 TaxID=2512219 RepID=UPI0010F2B8F7|nr:LLM class flavin-dependent oxidoreductase [Kribbella sp. VKM Ac-2568]TCM42743.1 luciferase-like monooxygenase [Kribbella sp. VKM Ac-2568]